jgi:hypothetical protein
LSQNEMPEYVDAKFPDFIPLCVGFLHV